MSRPSFNVLTEPWIPVVRKDGSQDELGILPCLENAHELREIRDPSPIIEFGLYRLLVAFVLDALILADQRPEVPSDLKDFIGSGQFDNKLLHAYVEKCGCAFDLFDDERPFLQSNKASGDEKSVFDPYPLMPTGANVTHFAHGNHNDQWLAFASATRLLVAISPFNVKVKTGSPKTIVGDPPLYCLPAGATLHETIVLNLPLPNTQFTRADELRLGPAWRTIASEEQSGTTPAQSFTWPTRFVKLVPDSTGVKRMHNSKGLRSLPTWIDPSCAVFFGDNKIRHLRLEEKTPLWADAGPLAVVDSGRISRWSNDWDFKRPQVVSNALEATGNLSVRLRFYGWRTDQAKVFEWHRSEFGVPVNLPKNERVSPIFMQELGKATASAQTLRVSLRTLYPREGADSKAALGCLSSRCERSYWQHLEREFAPLVSRFADLPKDAPDQPSLIEDARKPWRDAIEQIAMQQFEFAAKDMDADSDALERQVKARTKLKNSLRKVLQ